MPKDTSTKDTKIYEKKFWKLCRKLSSRNQTKIQRMIEVLGKKYFNAPASTRYHGSYAGGLLEHSIIVTEVLLGLIAATRKTQGKTFTKKEKRSCILVGLFHDIGKIGNEKENLYLEAEDWQKERNQPFVFNRDLGNIPHPLRSIRILTQFNIRLTEDEFQAIAYHNGLFTPSGEEIKNDFCELTIFLHAADMYAAYILGV